MPDFIPGLTLSRRFYLEVVGPLIEGAFPGLPYSAALIGPGSEVMGFDTEMSADHNWGPRLQLFLREEDHVRFSDSIDELLKRRLPATFLGYSTDCVAPKAAEAQVAIGRDSDSIAHRVEVVTATGYFLRELDLDLRAPIETADWLTFSQQKLREITSGAIYHDGIDIQSIRDRFVWFPHDVWLYPLAAGWNRIGQEGHLLGRTGFVGDEIGSAILGSRLARDIMRMGFLMERGYAPYPKWFGSAFAQLTCAPALSPLLLRVLHASTWQERERYLCLAYEQLTTMHNSLGLTEPLENTVGQFHTRPFQVACTEKFSDALIAGITDASLARIVERGLIGSIDQFSDSTDLLSRPSWRVVLRRLYDF